MKSFSILLLALLFTGPLWAVNPLPPDSKFQGSNNLNPAGSVIKNEGTVLSSTGTNKVGTSAATALSVGVPFSVTVTLTSAAAATPVALLDDAMVPTGKKVYITNWIAKVNGATDWATTTSVTLQDTASSPVTLLTLTASTLDGNEVHGPWSDSPTLGSGIALGTGATAAKGITIKGNANGTGSDLVFTLIGFIR